MLQETEKRKELLDDIVDLELRMFVEVRASHPSACQQHLNTFQRMRRMAHSALSDETLASYKEDLLDAFRPDHQLPDGCCMAPALSGLAELSSHALRRNFFVEKYARIEGQIPRFNHDVLIPAILAIEREWFAEMRNRFPALLHSTGAFEAYEEAELETYSHQTLALLARDIRVAYEDGRNLVEERYEYLSRSLGFSSVLEFAASAVAGRNGAQTCRKKC